VSGRRHLPACAALLAVASMPAAGAESLYVIEQLVANVTSEPTGGERVASIKSGERVEVIERVKDQVHVHLASGRDGWIRTSYLSAEEPLRLRLAQREAESAELRADVTRLKDALTAARAAGATPPAGGRAAASAEPGEPPTAPLLGAPPDTTPRRAWPWALGSGLAALVVGFLLGAWALDRRIRRKYGGLRIY